MIRINQIRLPLGSGADAIENKLLKLMRLKKDDVSWRISRHSVDARKRPGIFDVYSIDVTLREGLREEKVLSAMRSKDAQIIEEAVYKFPKAESSASDEVKRPVVVGFGPAGIFASYVLAKCGMRPIVIERGASMEERVESVSAFFGGGTLDPGANIQFGEGGAGTFSDGKLSTGTTDRDGRHGFIKDVLISCGAPAEIAYEQYAHIGTDILRGVIVNIRRAIEEMGGEIRFRTLMEEVVIEGGAVRGIRVNDGIKNEFIECVSLILAPGHSARDTFRMLHGIGVPMEAKNFAAGFRVIHPQSLIDGRMYGVSGEARESLGLDAASYKLTGKTASGRGIYSFCMCPGGYVVNASSADGFTAVNGMSDYGRDSGYANSAIVMTVGPEELKSYAGEGDLFAGMRFQEEIERKAYEMGGGLIPVSRFSDFIEKIGPYADTCQNTGYDKGSSADSGTADEYGLNPSSDHMTAEDKDLLDNISGALKGGYVVASLCDLYPGDMAREFAEGMISFDSTIPGFASPETLIAGPETRTSSPVRIIRGGDLSSPVRGLFPAGEGAGYAGGIISAAADGMRAAEAVIKQEALSWSTQ